MRKLVIAVTAVAGLGLAACQSNSSKVAEERKDVAEAQQNAAKKTAEAEREATQEKTEIDQNAREEMAKADREKGEEQREAQQDVREEQKDLAEAQRDAANDNTATGGSGAMATTDNTKATGPLMTTTGVLNGNQIGNQFTLKDAKGKELNLKTDDNTRIMYNNKKVDIDDFKEGTQVRASYVKQGEDNIARDVTVVRPVK